MLWCTKLNPFRRKVMAMWRLMHVMAVCLARQARPLSHCSGMAVNALETACTRVFKENVRLCRSQSWGDTRRAGVPLVWIPK